MSSIQMKDTQQTGQNPQYNSSVRKGQCFDIWRDSLLRFSGYSNELGEAFKNFLSRKIYLLSYGVAVFYSIGDVYDKTSTAYQESQDLQQITKYVNSGTATVDASIWQTLSNIVLPWFVISNIVNGTGFALHKYQNLYKHNLPGKSSKMITTLAGVASIPFICRPVDRASDRIMDYGVRPGLNMIRKRYIGY